MKMIIIHHSAEIELWQAVEYYESKRCGLGLEFEKEVSKALVQIQSAPERWPKKNHDTRLYLLKKFPYSIFYLDLSDFIWVVAFAHQKREPFYWRKRLDKI